MFVINTNRLRALEIKSNIILLTMYLFVAYTAHHIVGLHIPYGGGTFA